MSSFSAEDARFSLTGEQIYGMLGDMGDSRILTIRIKSATGLLKKDLIGLSDPFVKIFLCSELNAESEDTVIGVPAETTIQKRTLNPQWYEEFQFRVNPSRQYLLLEVWDHNKLTADDFLGMYRFSLFHLPVNNSPTGWDSVPVHDMVLKQRSKRSRVKGKLHVQFRYEPRSEEEDVGTSQVEAEEESGGWESVQEPEPLPEGWEERVDFSNRVVYVDHVNRIVSLDRPTAPTGARPSRGSIMQRQHSSFENRRQISEDNLDVEQDEQATATAPLEPQNEWESLETLEVVEEDGPSQSPLPEGWEETSDFSGRTVYVNRSLRLSQFDRPQRFELMNAPRPDTLQTGGGRDEEEEEVDAGPSSSAPPQPEPESPLPAGWAKGRDAKTGRTFYIDHNSRTTSWEKPKTRTDGLYAALGPLPEGWEMRYKNGRPFFIQHRTKITTWHDPRQEDPLPDGWEMRIHADGRVFYVDHTTKSTQWEDPRLHKESTGPAIQYSRDYKVKFENFKANLPQPTSNTAKCEIKVSRSTILGDSFDAVMRKTSGDLYKRLWVVFDGEPGLDYGGVAREWFYSLSKEMFNPYYGLWEYSAIDNYTLQINPNSGLCNPEHLRYFEFVGRICAMAVYHGKLVDGFFIRPFYKMMLGKHIVLDDMAEVDIETYNSLKWVMDNDPEDLYLTFCAQENRFGEMVETPLVAGGENIDVTNFNKLGYVKAYIQWKFVDRIEEQIKAFKNGFAYVIPLSKLAVFDENELEYLMCGIAQIDVEDWCKYTEFKGGYSHTHHVIVWFWKAVRSFDNEFRARLLQFVTGTSRVPMNGFRELQGSNGPQKFCIEKWGGPGDLPRAHTCFNRIDLPPYTDYHTLKDKLKTAVECTGGFEID